MSLIIIKHNIPKAFRGIESEEITQTKGFLDEIEKCFAKNDKVEMTSLLTSLMSMKYKGQGNVREYIMEMFHVASRLKALMVELSKELLVLMILEMQKVPYASAVGSLMYAQVCTCLDISYIVGMLGKYLRSPGMDNWIAAKRDIMYLQRTKDYIVTYKRLDHLEVVRYSDSNFFGCQDSRKSTSGYIYLLVGGSISWKSVKQTLVASSTMVVEFVACYEASDLGIWLQNFVIRLHILKNVGRQLKLFFDDKSTMLYSNNNMSSTKSKHIDIKFLVVKERVQSGQISIEYIEYIGINSMITNLLTKGLPPKLFHEHISNMGVILF
ncbi:Retrovirus-related Pol polyprotein from transposon TNT 1-94 [Gossypium australe]|uniref:Retrovirus-related Pol polyprotein from transposon TNT 1-94 n=1 Tax=Gossypium australe TaxID=47621 RepID=A0A5B6X3Q1_9ROSI|nr:Retrovirus-related Pol polyprotein from transposon TNT 1-94 [Gossypium australe]